MYQKRFLSVLLSVSLASGPSLFAVEPQKRDVRVAVLIANVRAEPSVEGRVLQQVRRGTCCECGGGGRLVSDHCPGHATRLREQDSR